MTDSKTIILRSSEQSDYAVKLINGLPKDHTNPKWTVTIEKYSKQRSTAQNSLYWKWLEVISSCKPKNILMTREKWHYAFAIMFLEPVEIPDLKTGEIRHCPQSTKGLNTGKFTEYLNQIEEWSIGEGIILPHPDDLIWCK
ncbi:recombination protein NinB [Dyadobacter bucti]|uniref:recombination protein NinB n=1 Tax=Dyadobacter bucti TaxID=2572203 RepID=UPI00140AA96D|nr:recombination protein NinB [Dyadobacter bucti]